MSRPDKHPDVLAAVKSCIEQDHYLDTCHVTDRQKERSITRPEILFVLKNGRHEKSKDKFDELHKAWNYAIRGKTVDKREIRVIVSFDDAGMLIITAIDLEK